MAAKRARAAHSPSTPAGIFQMQHTEDPAIALSKSIGDISNVAVMGCNLLVATYKRPEKTKGGLFTGHVTGREDEFQSKVGLVLKTGPYAFRGDNEAKFGDTIPKVGQWVVFSPQLGLATSIRGVHCRIMQDVDLDMIVDNPDDIW